MSAMMAPLVTPITSWEANCPGSCTAWTRSNTSTTAAITAAMRVSQPEPLMLCSRASGLLFAAPPVVIGLLFQQRGPAREAGPHADYPWLLLEVRYVDDPVERELAAVNRLDGEPGQARSPPLRHPHAPSAT